MKTRDKGLRRHSVLAMDDGIRLHLGCGSVYRPGRVNVDRYDSSVADVRGDIMSLPFAAGSADGVEAFHVVEHFDIIHCRYLLSEWYAVLKGGGELVLETPDLTETFKRFVKSDPDGQEQRLHWVYGIDSPGMSHKAGLSFDLAHKLLGECGFVDIRRGEPSTHLYEAGMRIECRKPEGDRRAEFAASLRRNLLVELGPVDSYVMVPLEKHVRRVLDALPTNNPPTEDEIIDLAATMVPVNAGIALALVRTWMGYQEGAPGESWQPLERIRSLGNSRIHERIFTLWIRARKDGPLEARFREFMDRLGRDVLGFVTKGSQEDHDRLAYVLSLEPQEIPLMDFELVLMDARTRVNKGVREFASGDSDEARAILEFAAMENPENLYAHWNLARLGAVVRSGGGCVEEHYEKAISLAHGTELKRNLERELASYRRAGPDAIPSEPVTE
jgi:SAM-dependent methyltransferase